MLLNNFYTLDALVSNGDVATATVTLNPLHEVYQGHFPGNPVVPGVSLITIVKEVFEKVIGQPVQIAEARSIKFLQVLNPEQRFVLEIHYAIRERTDTKWSVDATIFAGGETAIKSQFQYRRRP